MYYKGNLPGNISWLYTLHHTTPGFKLPVDLLTTLTVATLTFITQESTCKSDCHEQYSF